MSYSYNENNLINLGHLKALAERSYGDIADLAAIVVGAIEDLILQADITIATSAWVANTDSATLAEGYSYQAVVPVTGLIEQANVNVTFSVPSLTVAAKARVSQTVAVFVENGQGKLRFYSMYVPTASLTAKVDAIQLDEGTEEQAADFSTTPAQSA